MKHWLLRYEASDFDNSLFDSSQLSAIRGASLTFLYSSELVERLVTAKAGASARTIYAGASQGAFCFLATQEDAVRLKADVEAALAKPDTAPGGDGKMPTGCHQHMAYVVALTEGYDHAALIRAEALCNAAAAQKAFPALPAFGRDQTQPGERRDPRPALAGGGVSAAIRDRSEFGRRQRQNFYQRFLREGATGPGFDFTDEFEEITQGGDKLFQLGSGKAEPRSRLPLSLQNKMAVFYADGNAFGKHRDGAIEQAKDLSGLTKLSAHLIKLQQDLLKTILDWLEGHYQAGQENAWFAFDSRDKTLRARFETLMWGGDEMLFVLPSWLAFDFAELFFSTVDDWTVGDNPLTFSAGMVICDRKTPISQAKTVAQNLSDAAKKIAKDAGPYGLNTLQIEIFEGLWLPEHQIDSFRARLYFHGRPIKGENSEDPEVAKEASEAREEQTRQTNLQLTIRGDDIGGLAARITDLQKKLPRSQVQKLLDIGSREGVAHTRTARALKSDDRNENEVEHNDQHDAKERPEHTLLRETLEEYLRRAGSESKLHPRELSVLRPIDGKPASLALDIAMIARLWDYVVPVSSSEPVQGEA